MGKGSGRGSIGGGRGGQGSNPFAGVGGNFPSTTGNPSGGGRGNNAPSTTPSGTGTPTK
jgi:hypothetical protein